MNRSSLVPRTLGIAATGLAGALILAAGTLAAGTRQSTPGAGAGGCPAATPAATVVATAAATSAAMPSATPVAERCVTIGMYDIYFQPKEVTIPADTPVTLVFPNKGATLHNFSITDHTPRQHIRETGGE